MAGYNILVTALGNDSQNLPNPQTAAGITLISNEDPAYSIDLSSNASMPTNQTFTLGPSMQTNWGGGESLYARITPGQSASATAVAIWVQPGSPAASQQSLSITGVDATAIQGTSVSTTAPTTTNNSFVFNGTIWVPGPVNAVELQGNPISTAAPVIGNALIWNGTNWAPSGASTSPVTARVYLAGAQTIPYATPTVVAYDTVVFDTNTAFNTVTHKYICPTTGYYRVYGQTAIAGAIEINCQVSHNGSVTANGPGAAATYTGGNVAGCEDLVSCAAGDDLEIIGISGSNPTTTAFYATSQLTFATFELVH
jgi:hypothetical protein